MRRASLEKKVDSAPELSLQQESSRSCEEGTKNVIKATANERHARNIMGIMKRAVDGGVWQEDGGDAGRQHGSIRVRKAALRALLHLVGWFSFICMILFSHR
jgi:hypothetical protein